MLNQMKALIERYDENTKNKERKQKIKEEMYNLMITIACRAYKDESDISMYMEIPDVVEYIANENHDTALRLQEFRQYYKKWGV